MTSLKSLEKLRQEIDRIDDTMHDLLIQRSQVAEKIGELKGDGAVSLLRPGREAEILRRIVSRHQGKFPNARSSLAW